MKKLHNQQTESAKSLRKPEESRKIPKSVIVGSGGRPVRFRTVLNFKFGLRVVDPGSQTATSGYRVSTVRRGSVSQVKVPWARDHHFCTQ